MLKAFKLVDPALAGPLVNFHATAAQMRGRETPYKQVGGSKLELDSIFLVEFAA